MGQRRVAAPVTATTNFLATNILKKRSRAVPAVLHAFRRTLTTDCGGTPSFDGQRFHVSSDLTGGDTNMRYALVIATLLGPTLLAQAEPIDRDKWIAQTERANKSCLAKFRQKFGEDKGHNYSGCVTDQTNKAIDDCVGRSEFSNCVLEKSLKVLQVCDLSNC
jgi:hypothetical protein